MAFTLGATPTRVFENGAGQANVATTTYTAGNGLVAIVWWYHATITLDSVIYDPGGANQTTLTQAGSPITLTDVSRGHIWYLSNVPTTASKVVRATWSSGLAAKGALQVYEVIGGNITDMLDNTPGSGTGSGTSISCSVTTLTDNCCLFAVTSDQGGDPSPSGAGYVETATNAFGWYDSGEYNLDVGTNGSKTPTMTVGSGSWGMKAAAFKLVGGAAVLEQTHYRFRADDGGLQAPVF